VKRGVYRQLELKSFKVSKTERENALVESEASAMVTGKGAREKDSILEERHVDSA